MGRDFGEKRGMIADDDIVAVQCVFEWVFGDGGTVCFDW